MNILKELAAALPAGGPHWFKPTKFLWSLNLDGNGVPTHPSLIPLADPSDPDSGVTHDSPGMTRSGSGTAPFLGADNLKYVLGWATLTPKNPKPVPPRTLKCRDAFAEAISAVHTKHPNDRDVAAVHAFYANGHHLDVVHPEGKWAEGDNLLLTVKGCPVFDSPALQAVWASTVIKQKGAKRAATTCVVCGQTKSTLSSLPQGLAPRLLPGSDKGVSVISANKKLFGHTQIDQLPASPICESCGEALVKNLRTMAGLSYRKGARTNATAGAFHVKGMKTQFIWWVSPGATLNLDPIDRPTPGVVAELLNRVQSKPGAVTPSGTAGVFYGLTLAANAARLVITETMSTPVGDVERHLAAWFTDMQLVAQDPAGREMFSLWRLVQTFGIDERENPAKPAGKGKPAKPKGYSLPKGKDVDKAHDPHRPPRTHQHLLHAALTGGSIPPMYLHHLIRRITSDHGLRDDRVAAIKLCLARYPNPNQEITMPTPGLDPSNDNPAYLSGQIMALLGRIQQVSYDPSYRTKVNASFIDKYLSTAIGNPARAIVSGRQQAEAWLKKTHRDNPGLGKSLSKELTGLFDRFTASVGLPERLSITEQALFILGYHQYQADSKRRFDVREAERQAKALSDAAAEQELAHAELDDAVACDVAATG